MRLKRKESEEKKMRRWMKKGIAALLACVMLLGNLPAYTYAAAPDKNGFVIENGVLIRYTGTAEDVEVPEGVWSIGAWAFSDCSGLKTIRIPASVMNIGARAFAGCSGLKTINIPASVTRIGPGVFSDCSGLKTISIPWGVTSIGDWAFAGCSGLKTISIPASVTRIEEFSFADCSGLTMIRIPANVTSIDFAAFSGCDRLTIYGERNSYAQAYAEEEEIPFRLTGSIPNLFSALEIMQLTEKNRTRDVIIRNEEGLTFTFKKGSMRADGVANYDFGATLTESYTDAKLPKTISKAHFALKIDFKHSGELPGKAIISIPVGKYKGKEVIYAILNEDGTYTPQQEATVNRYGFLVVEQDHCSSYIVLTKEAVGDANGDGKVTVADALAILMHLADKEVANFDEGLADVDKDGKIAVADALAILMHLADKKLLTD